MPANVLAGCYVISLRPVGMHAAMRRAASVHGARVLALSPCRLLAHGDAMTRHALDNALACERVLFTSPFAVRAAQALRTLRGHDGTRWFAVGKGTANALRNAGVDTVATPRRMDSEGLLSLPDLVAVRDMRIGVITAPGGRDVIEPMLHTRGAQVFRADVYERVAVPPSPRSVAALRSLDAPAWLALSSGEALQHMLATLPIDARQVLHRARVIAASERLAKLAHSLGFGDVTIAASAMPADLMAAIVGSVSVSMPARDHSPPLGDFP